MEIGKIRVGKKKRKCKGSGKRKKKETEGSKARKIQKEKIVRRLSVFVSASSISLSNSKFFLP